MKTRLLIIIGIVLATTIFGVYQSVMYQCGTLPIFMETPKHPNLWNCLEIWEKQNYPPPMNLSAERDSAWITSAKDELVNLGCTEPAINHLSRYSNLLDDSFDGTYSIEWIGLPDDLSQVEFDKCVEIIVEKRTSVELENEN